MKRITKEVLDQHFSYDPHTGLFTRISRPCNRVKAGDVATCKSSEGYVHFRVEGTLYRAHRLAWLTMTGEWPETQIDHINGDRADNRFSNLRLVTNGENQQNRRHARIDNKSSNCMGVGFFRPQGKWRARIQVNKKSVLLGYFDSEAAASNAYQKAKQQLHPFAPQNTFNQGVAA